jgi:carboxyl-terminal processing protease
MNRKPILIIGGLLLGFVLLTTACIGGFLVGRLPLFNTASVPSPIVEQIEKLPRNTPNLPEPSPVPPTHMPADEPVSPEGATPEDLTELFEPFWQAWEIIHTDFVDQPVDDEVLLQGAIRGMLESLGDEHTSYMNPDEYRQANIPLEGEYEGIGAWVDPDAEFLTIVSPMPGSPAEKAGLLPGDQIIAVDGENVTGIDGNLVIRRVLGPAGTNVILTIHRDGEPEPFDVTITRARITIPSVEYHMLEEDIGYVQLFTFGNTTTRDLQSALEDLLAENPRGLILDLRNNGGGFLTTAIEVASEFIDEGVVLYEQFGDGSRDTFYATGEGMATEIPLVVLVNEGTASASEIVAGAIQDHERGVLVGVTTFGKGSVQTWRELTNNQGAIRVTIARWLTPDEKQIHGVGLEPDEVIELPQPEPGAETQGEQPVEVQDVQLERAIEILLEN